LSSVMVEIELMVEYRQYGEACRRLEQILVEDPDYLPAKEALHQVYRLRGQAKRAQDLQCEIRGLLDRRAEEQLSPSA